MEEAYKFSWFPKFMQTVDSLPEEIQAEFALGVLRYGSYGTDPGFGYPLSSVFISIKEDIDNSRSAINNNRGGRPKKQVLTEEKTGVFETKNGGFEDTKPNTNQTNTSHTNNKKKVPKKNFDPPSFEEAESYRIEADLSNTDTHQFLDYYEANGWVIGRNKPMKDWRAAMRNWDRRQAEWKKPNEKGGLDGIDPEYLQWANS